MRQIIYIIPGLGEDCQLLRYQKLKNTLQSNGYKVRCVNPDWYKPLSDQVFRIERNAILFGFSFGAILAYLIAKKYPCKKVIFASISPIHKFSFRSLVRDLNKHMSKDLSILISKDIKNIKISLGNIDTSYVTIAGEYERLTADFIVPKTRHRITNRYIDSILSTLTK